MQKTRHKHCAFCLWYFAIARSTAQTSARNACSFFLYPFQRLRKRKLNGMVLWYFAVAHTNAKNSAQALCFLFVVLCYRSFHGTNFGTQRVLVFFISVSTFAQAQVKRYGFVVFRCRSYQCKKLGTSIVLFVCGTLLSLVPRHKLRHATRARFFYIRFNVCASAS